MRLIVASLSSLSVIVFVTSLMILFVPICKSFGTTKSSHNFFIPMMSSSSRLFSVDNNAGGTAATRTTTATRTTESAVGNDAANSKPSSSLSSSSSSSPPSIVTPWKIYPVHQYNDVQTLYGIDNVKLVHMVRHAEGTHNVNREYKDIKNLDARLTDKGKQQCSNLASYIVENIPSLTSSTTSSNNNNNNNDNNKNDICVLTSPLTRCIQTALYSFPFLVQQQKDDNVPFIALESLRETVNYNCDRRRTINEISKEFSFSQQEQQQEGDEQQEQQKEESRIDFSFIQYDDDEIWNSYQRRVVDNDKTWDTHLESAELHVVAKRGIDAFTFLQARTERQIVVCTHSAYLRCILSWGQTGGVPRLMEQKLDDRIDKTNHKLFEYLTLSSSSNDNDDSNDKSEQERKDFEEYMRRDYDNCELRSFVLVTNP